MHPAFCLVYRKIEEKYVTHCLYKYFKNLKYIYICLKWLQGNLIYWLPVLIVYEIETYYYVEICLCLFLIVILKNFNLLFSYQDVLRTSTWRTVEHMVIFWKKNLLFIENNSNSHIFFSEKSFYAMGRTSLSFIVFKGFYKKKKSFPWISRLSFFSAFP